jgi:hypothetical protein
MMTISYTNGHPATTIDDYDAAVELLTRDHPDAIFIRRDGWEGGPDENISVLVWRNADDAGPRGSGDDGSKAIAEISFWPGME